MKLEYHSSLFFGLIDPPAFVRALQELFRQTQTLTGSFTGDNLITFEKNLSFLSDDHFMSVFRQHAQTRVEKGIIWRTWTLAWAAKNALRLKGDLVECACYKGVSARIVCDYLNFGAEQRSYFLYDLFEHDPSMPHHRMSEHGEGLYEQVLERFTDFQNVRIVRGRVPEAFAQAAPQEIALLHIDLNNAEAEIAVLDALFERVVAGGAIILDDYGWLYYRQQKLAHDAWFAKRGYSVLELPTGQGLVIR